MGKTLEIGITPLKKMTAEDLKQLVIIEGCCPSLEYWNEPQITDFNNTIFSDTHILDFHSYRKEDNLKSSDYVFFFNFKDFRIHYTVGYERNKNHQPNGKRLGLDALRFLIKCGYDIPIYNI